MTEAIPCGAALAMIIGLATATPASIQARDNPPLPTVLLLSSLRSTNPGSVLLESAFRREIDEGYGGPVDLQVEYLDLPEPSAALYTERLADLLQVKYRGRRIDVVVAVRYEALRFVLEHRNVLFAGVPVVATAIDRKTFEALQPPDDVRATLLRLDDHRTMSVALDLHPQAHRAVLMGGSSPADVENLVLARRLVEARSPGLEILSLTGLPLEEQLRRLAKLPRDDVVFFVSYRADSQGRSMIARDVLRLAAEASSAPLYGTAENWLGLGIVGGDLLDHALLGERAAGLASRILRGEAPASLPVVEERASRLQFDGRQLQRWGIEEARLPADSVVLFREKTLWSEHRGKILGGLVVILAQAFLIAALLAERRQRRSAEAGLREAERRYRTLADFTHDWEYWMRPDGAFEYVSPSCHRMTGHAADAFYRRPGLLDELVVEEDLSRWRRHDEESRDGNGPAHLEFRIRRADGRAIWLDHVCAPVESEDGRFLGVRASNRDVTERKESEERLRGALAEIERLRERLDADNTYLRQQVEPQPGFEGFVGRSDVVRYTLSRVQQVAPTSTTVLLLGETGVGKDLLAHALHSLSPRRDRPLVKLNCATLPAGLVESELFGHEKGAFTGAAAQRKGRFELADGTTLFLDEVGELPLELQAKLLRVIQDGEYERVGGTATLKTDVRLVAATNRQLEEEVRAGRFREDLWYRLNVFPITVPPLRQRKQDIPLLVQHFVERHCRRLGRPPLEVSQATLHDLLAHGWSGNVRELENVVERAVITSPGPALRISLAGLVEGSGVGFGAGSSPRAEPEPSPLARAGRPRPDGSATPQTLTRLERDHIVNTLERTYWRLEGEGGAAALLGINPSTLRSRMRKLGIQRPRSREFGNTPRTPSDT